MRIPTLESATICTVLSADDLAGCCRFVEQRDLQIQNGQKSVSDIRLHNADLTFWQETAKAYRERPDGGPTLRIFVTGHFKTSQPGSNQNQPL